MSVSSAMSRFRKQYFSVFVCNMIFAIAIYSHLMVNQLVNSYDGLWWGSYFIAGNWESSLGRWLWPFIDRLHMGLSIDPLTSLFTLTCYCVGCIVLLDQFQIRKKKLSFLICSLFLSNTFIGFCLSYRYMSPIFGLAFLLSIISARCIMEFHHPIMAIVSGALLLAMSMGLYQAYLGCTCIALLSYLVVMLFDKKLPLQSVAKKAIRSILSIGLGGVLYVAAFRFFLWFKQIEMSDYKGLSSYSLQNTIVKLPRRIVFAYRAFLSYFYEDLFKPNAFQPYSVHACVFILFIALLLISLSQLWKHSRCRAVLGAFLLLLIPLACNVVFLIATDSFWFCLQTAPHALCIPLLLCIEETPFDRIPLKRILRQVMLLFMIVVLYGNTLQVLFDQNALQEGRRTTVGIANRIIDKLDDDGLLTDETVLCVVGSPSQNPLFKTTDAFSMANTEFRFGDFYTDPKCMPLSWKSVFHGLCGLNIPYCTIDAYKKLIADETLRDMPLFPAEGSIRQEDGVTVVKVSNDY